MRRLAFALLTLLSVTFISVSRADIIEWDQPAFGVYGSGSSWTHGEPPEFNDSPIFGTSLTTVNTEVGVLFNDNQTAPDAWVASGEYEFRFGNADVTYDVGAVVVGGSDTEFIMGAAVSVADFLPASASLAVRIPQFSFPGTIINHDLTVGSPPFPDETIRPGRMSIEGSGTRWLLVYDEDNPDTYFGRATIGATGNSGTLEVRDGAYLDVEEAIFLGGGSSRPFPGKPEIEIGHGTLIVDGRDSNDVPSTVRATYLEIGNGDFDRAVPRGSSDIVVSVGTASIDNGGFVHANSVFLGDSGQGLLANSRVEGTPQDTLTIARGGQLPPELASRLEISRELRMGIESYLDVTIDPDSIEEKGGIVTVGDVPVLEQRLGAVHVGVGGRLNGVGTIRGDLELVGGTINPGFTLTRDNVPIGSLTLDGNLSAPSGQFVFEVFGDESGLTHDHLFATGNIIVAGDIDIRFADFVPHPGDTFELISAAQGISALGDVTYSDAPAELLPLLDFEDGVLRIIPDYNGNGEIEGGDIDLLVANFGNPFGAFDVNEDGATNHQDVQALIFNVLGTRFGDTNLDGRVDESDLEILQANLFHSSGWSGGDFNGDGEVDGRDFNLWIQYRGFDRGAPASVPEPWGLAVLAPGALVLRQRKQWRNARQK
ncbi:MAG: hypothetical protein KDA60_09280 [Planctomycetales bacterium]|nr:hypothetical protein [Planctomycetales bacterium]